MGHVTVVGGCRAKAPSTGILASTLPVGSVVKLMEGGTTVEYLVVNQGIPSNSSLYDASCDGTWLLRKDIHSERQWNTSNVNAYANSAIHTWLNGDFFNSLGSVEQSAIKQVKIPYCVGGESSTINSAASGLSVKVFLLGDYEVGFSGSNQYYPQDSANLDYFIDHDRTAYLNGSTISWWTRSPYTYSTTGAILSSWQPSNTSNSGGIRPALVLPKTALFDETTLQLKGVA